MVNFPTAEGSYLLCAVATMQVGFKPRAWTAMQTQLIALQAVQRPLGAYVRSVESYSSKRKQTILQVSRLEFHTHKPHRVRPSVR